MPAKHFSEWTREQLAALPVRAWNCPSDYQAVLIVPRRICEHASGYAWIDVIGCADGETPTEIAACCDHIAWVVRDGYINTDASFPGGVLRMHSAIYRVGLSLSSTKIEVIAE